MRAKKVDENQSEIVAEFRRLGWGVEITSSFGCGWPDLFVARVYTADDGTCSWEYHLVEIKSKTGKYTKAQEGFMHKFPGLAITVRSIEDVKELFG